MKLLFTNRDITFLTIALLVLTTKCSAGLVFDTQEIREKTSAEDQKAAMVFRFKNTGLDTVTIKSVQPSCDCTTAEVSKQVYAAGETGEIKAVFTFGGHVGLQKKWIEVKTDEAPEKPITLTLYVDITEPISCSSHLLQWTLGEINQEQSVLIESIGKRKILSVAIKSSSPPEIAAHIEPQGIAGQFRLFARPLPSGKLLAKLIPCEATFVDGSKYSFVVSALIR